MDNEPLFSDSSLQDELARAVNSIETAVAAVGEDAFRSWSNDEVYAHVLPSFDVSPLVLHEGHKQIERIEPQRVRQFVNGRDTHGETLAVKLHLPFDGTPSLWRRSMGKPERLVPLGRVGTDEQGRNVLTFKLETTLANRDALTRAIEGQLKIARHYIAAQQPHIDEYRRWLPMRLMTAIRLRREKLAEVDAALSSLNIEIKPRSGMPPVRTLPLERKLPIQPKPVSSKPEWTISDESYETILGLLRHCGATFEEAPATFAALGEEGLRHVMRAMLNAYFKGSAQGESFRGAGKTDISIVHESRSAFVAECKVWSGTSCVHPALDQLLSYTTWRDRKLAAVFFNLSVLGVTDLREKMEAALRSHPGFVGLDAARCGEWALKLRDARDSGKVVSVCVFLINVVAHGASSSAK